MGSMNKYSVIVGSAQVMTVTADSKAQARKKARHQLKKPGRRRIFRQWQDSGERVEKKE